MKVLFLCLVLAAFASQAASTTETAATAINALGLDLLAKAVKTDDNALLSPYSIQSALAMTCAGAEGVTRTEMAKVLHFPADDLTVHRSFAALQTALAAVAKTTAEVARRSKQYGGPSEPIRLTVANRLFGQKGYDFRASFLTLVKENYGAPFGAVDFIKRADVATKQINAWVENQTRQRIRDLIPAGALNALTRLLLVNAVYLKAPWANEFLAGHTKPRPFRIGSGKTRDVPTMLRQDQFGYAKFEGFSAVTIPYIGRDVHLLILLPDQANSLGALEAKVTASLLAQCATLNPHDVILYLPKFKLEPPVLDLKSVLLVLGMKTAFDQPRGSANFDRLAPRHPDDYLYISKVFHKTFLSLDEKGTEAAAATAVVTLTAIGGQMEPPKPIEVKVDRPFLFAIQHRPSGACLFLGHITDPR